MLPLNCAKNEVKYGFVDYLRYVVGSVDGVASINDAQTTLNNVTPDTYQAALAAYNAAYANAEAVETAFVTGVGAIFASAAFNASLKSFRAHIKKRDFAKNSLSPM